MKVVKHCNEFVVFDSVEELLKNVDEFSLIAKYGDINMEDSFALSHVKEDFKNILEILGFYDIDVCYDMNYIQGRGASFTAEWSYNKGCLKKIKEYAPNNTELHNIAENLKYLARRLKWDVYGKVYRVNYRYCHSNTISIDLWSNTLEVIDDDFDLFSNMVQDLCIWFEKQLDAEIDYLISIEAIADRIVINEIEIPMSLLKKGGKNDKNTSNSSCDE